MEYKVVTIATVTVVILVTMDCVRGQVDDYSDPISCYYCFGPANNSTCADPVNPKEDKGKTLTVIECDSGICLKWTHYYGNPISCYYCFGPAENSTCADPVNPKEDKGKTLTVIECDSGICLKWTHYYGNTLYMHRTCSDKLSQFKIMMIDGVCRSERTGNGYLCMCGRHLCNNANSHQSVGLLCTTILATLSIVFTLFSRSVIV